MDSEKFDLVFSGELVPGFELPQVKRNLQGLFRIDETKVNALFDGRSITLKKGMDAITANKYRVAMKKAGARVAVVESTDKSADKKAEGNVPTGIDTTSAKRGNEDRQSASSGEPSVPPDVAEPAQDHRPPLSEQAQVAGADAPSGQAEIEAPDFPLADVGEDLLREDERPIVAPVAVDISGLSLREQQGNLVDAGELSKGDETEVAIPDYQVDPAGSDVLRPEERRPVEMREMDVSFELAEVGTKLSPEKPAPPPPPSVEHIKLKD